MDYNDKLEALEREQSELRQMIGEGITFDVEVTYTRRKPGLLGFFRKREKITEKKVFRVQEPTLATLDRLSALWLQMSIDETKLYGGRDQAGRRENHDSEHVGRDSFQYG